MSVESFFDRAGMGAFKRTLRKEDPKEKLPASKATAAKVSRDQAGNLPTYYQGARMPSQTLDRISLVVPRGKSFLADTYPGQIARALIPEAIKVSPMAPQPIKAYVDKGPYSGWLLGEATLDAELKRIFIQFRSLTPQDGKTYKTDGICLDMEGRLGLEGEHHSHEGLFFLAELAAAGAASLADSTVTRSQNILGNYVEEPSLATSAKKGLAGSLSKTTERIAQKAKSAPEWTELGPVQEIQVLFKDRPYSEEK